MSEVITCKESDLRPVVTMLATLIPAGEKGVPVGIHVHDGVMLLTCNSGVLYQGRVPISSGSDAELTVMYTDILPMLYSGVSVTFTFEERACTISSAGFLFTLYSSYGIVEEIPVDRNSAQRLGENALFGVRKILNLRLEKLYSRPAPIEVANGLCVIKYPNVVAQSRIKGLPADILLDARYADLLDKFQGGYWDTSNPTAVTSYTETGSVLSVPCRQSNSSFSVMELLKDMQSATTLHLENYGEKLRTVMKLYGKVTCRVAVYSDGITSTVMSANSKVAVGVGKCTALMSVFNMPIEPLITFMSAFKEGMSEILVGGGKLCLRNQELVIVTSTLP